MSGPLETSYFRAIQESAVRKILGMDRHLPLTPEEMAASLRITFFPVASQTERVRAFATRLEQAHGTAAYATLRERHRELLRAAFSAHGGREQGTEGDSFFVVFPAATHALAAALDA